MKISKLNCEKAIHPDLLEVQKAIYLPCNLICNKCIPEAESREYGACDLEMNDRRIKFRVGKTTPTKSGQFVTLWKRNPGGPILPFDLDDPVDFFVVSVRSNEHFGQFVFPISVLYEKGVVSKNGKGGKRAMRVYPSWDLTENRQAKKTQAWQVLYFFEIDFSKSLDINRIQQLFQA